MMKTVKILYLIFILSAFSPCSANDNKQSLIWPHLIKQFALPKQNHPSNHLLIKNEINHYQSQAFYFSALLNDTERYLYFIAQQIKQNNLPSELALIPIIESSFNPFAYSPGQAAGIWQIIPATGKQLKLKQNWWYDGRRDIVSSTKAALKLLKKYHRQFNSNWLLAIAAYNAGPGNVRKAIKKNKGNDNYWELDLPSETKRYIPKLFALAEIFRHPEKYNIKLNAIINQPYFTIINNPTQIDLSLAAKFANITMKEIYYLNPGFNRWATPPDGPHRILIPHLRENQYLSALKAYPEKDHIKWTRHKIKQGQSLNKIARLYHTDIELIKQANNIKNNLIKSGQRLLIPISKNPQHKYIFSIEQRKKTILQSQRKNTRKGIKIIYTVKTGDTLWDLSRQFNTSVKKITFWNQVATRDPITPGQKLAIWIYRKKNQTNASSINLSSNHLLQKINYTVRSGDSLYKISKKFSVNIDDLRLWNAINKGQIIKPGQKLTLLVDVTQQTTI